MLNPVPEYCKTLFPLHRKMGVTGALAVVVFGIFLASTSAQSTGGQWKKHTQPTLFKTNDTKCHCGKAPFIPNLKACFCVSHCTHAHHSSCLIHGRQVRAVAKGAVKDTVVLFRRINSCTSNLFL